MTSKKLKILILVMILIAHNIIASEFVAIEIFQKKYSEAVTKLTKTFENRKKSNTLNALNQLKIIEGSYQKAGELNELLALRKFLKKAHTEDILQLSPPDLLPVQDELKKLVQSNKNALDIQSVDLFKLKKNYMMALQKKVKFYTQKDKIETALSFQAELEKIKTDISNTTPKVVEKKPSTVQKPKAVVQKPKIVKISTEWETDFGPMHIFQTGNTFKGYYLYKNARNALNGKISGTKMTGTWSQKGRTGGFEFSLSTNGQSFTGFWTEKNKKGGAWSGKKVK